MSMESNLSALLASICPRSFPDIAPHGTITPYITWQSLGGKVLRNLDKSASDKRNTLMQINVWADTRLAATSMIRQVEDAMCASALFSAEPESEPLNQYEDDPPIYGSLQRFSINSFR